jgi:phage recombination protein Bet
MSNALQVLNQNTSLITPEEVDVLKKTMFAGFTDAEVKASCLIANQLRLSPLLRQIHFVKRGGKVVPQTGIDGMRLTAERSGAYAGSDEPVFTYLATDTAQERPIKASLTVYKIVSGQRCAFQASARWDEYYPGATQGQMWRKMPHTMLAKCAEALALRKAFPAELSSVYSDDEMDQADRNEPTGEKAKAVAALVKGAPQEKHVEAEVTPVRPTPAAMVDNIRRAAEGTVQPEPRPAQGELAPDDGGDFVVPFGKQKGMTLRELTRDEIEEKIDWINKKAQKPLSKGFVDFLAAAEYYLANEVFQDDAP